jgi:Ran GTPase-activating protein (RanGAP) involved in mRNA processing and transport
VLQFQQLEWRDEDAEAFAKVLPLLRRVETLDLSSNMIGTRGIAALAAAIREGAAPALKKFVFTGPNHGDSTALKEACKARGISRD